MLAYNLRDYRISTLLAGLHLHKHRISLLRTDLRLHKHRNSILFGDLHVQGSVVYIGIAPSPIKRLIKSKGRAFHTITWGAPHLLFDYPMTLVMVSYLLLINVIYKPNFNWNIQTKTNSLILYLRILLNYLLISMLMNNWAIFFQL